MICFIIITAASLSWLVRHGKNNIIFLQNQYQHKRNNAAYKKRKPSDTVRDTASDGL
jgi:hypothetical protein